MDLPTPPTPRRLTFDLPVVNLCVALWLLGLLNAPFWRALWAALGGWDAGHAGFLISLPLFILAWVWLVLELLTWGRAAKAMLALVLAVSAAAAFFMDLYGVVFDRSMVENIFQTDAAEALDLVGTRLAGWMLVFAVPPVWLLSRVRIVRKPWSAHLLSKATTIATLLCTVAVIVAPFFQSYAPFLRNNRALRLYLVPTNYLGALYGYARVRFERVEPVQPVALDATRPAGPVGSKPMLTVLVIGETARAANFGLGGYARATTPALAAEPGVIYFTQAQSCGTSTAVSLPCMFLDVGRSGYDGKLAMRRENLLDVLQRTGVSILWRDNDSGCKGICDRVPHEDLWAANVPGLCASGECYDEILLDGLQEKLDALKGHGLVVLHMKGSHGPAYYRRYPAAFERFTPACQTNELDRCERSTIVNAYDNTLLYTDHVLARTIGILRRNEGRFATSLLYVSDHGESLGEKGLYLHGMPFAIAPAEQTHVPFLAWFSEDGARALGLDTRCMRARREQAISHDNLYHSVLGLWGLQTRVYRPELDVFQACRAALATGH